MRCRPRGLAMLAVLAVLAGCGGDPDPADSADSAPGGAGHPTVTVSSPTTPATPVQTSYGAGSATYVVHWRIPATTFWVGEVFDAKAADGSQRISTYDSRWLRHYGGCDGRIRKRVCRTERRRARNGWFPRRMRPKENPFYLDVPFDDVNDPIGFRTRCQVIPWAKAQAPHRCGDRNYSYLKNHWVKLIGRNGRVCYGQVQDAGPGRYHDAAYVFGGARPANRRYGGAGLDVSPALNGCLGFRSLNGTGDLVTWQFVDRPARGPWLRKVTRRGVS